MEARSTGRGSKKLRPASIRKLDTALNAFAEFIGPGYRSLQADQLDGTLLREFVLSQARRVSTGTANHRLDCVSQVLEFGVRRHLLLHNPAPKVERAFTETADGDGNPADDAIVGWPCPTAEEVRLILAHAAPRKAATGKLAYNGSHTGRAVYRGINANDYTEFYATLCLTGMRLGEARFLTWDNIDLISKVILIRPGHKNGIHWRPKTRSSILRIAIVPELEVILDHLRHSNRNNAWIFETHRGTQLGSTNPTKRFRQICEVLGFKKHFVVHSLRKYWASTVAQQGMDWKVMLKMFGHSDFELILSTYYAQNDDVRLVEETSKIDFGLGLPKTA